MSSCVDEFGKGLLFVSLSIFFYISLIFFLSFQDWFILFRRQRYLLCICFCGLSNYFSFDIDAYRDVFVGGDVQKSIEKLVKLLDWQDELNELVENWKSDEQDD